MPEEGCASGDFPSLGVEDDEDAEPELDVLDLRESGRIDLSGERDGVLLTVGTKPDGRVSALDIALRFLWVDIFSVL